MKANLQRSRTPAARRDARRRAMTLLAAAALAGFGRLAGSEQISQKGPAMTKHPYIGMWITKDGYIRHELLPNGRYDEARGKIASAYQGRYEIRSNHIEYWDDTGFTADGDFRDGVLYHAGMVLYREKP